MSKFWIGHEMLGDVIGFVAAAHLYSEKIGKPVEVYFQESRKDILKYFDGVVWVPKEPGMIDCGIDPTLDQWFQETPKMNGVSRFYRFMDPSMTPTKSFDVHFNRERKHPTEKIIGLITHSNTQGDIDDQTLETMLSDARKAYPEHRICLIGNHDNKKFPAGVEDWRQEKGDINWIISTIEKCTLLITPQSGPCFIAAGFRIPMWVYRSKERFWDCVLNYDQYVVERWYDRPKEAKSEKKFLYINWKTGLGDAILHVSLYYHYAKHTGKKIYFYGNSKLIDRKMREFVNIARIQQPDIDSFIEQVPVEKIRPVDNGPEDFSNWIPVPSDNCIPDHWKDYNCSRFISCFIKVMNFDGKNRKADELQFPHDYLRYPQKSCKGKVVFHLIGSSSGDYSNNYHISKQKIIDLVYQVKENGWEVVFLQPHDSWMKQTFPWATFKDFGNDLKLLFDELAESTFVVAVDSGIAHAALCCRKNLFLFKLKNSGGLGFLNGDAQFIDDNTLFFYKGNCIERKHV